MSEIIMEDNYFAKQEQISWFSQQKVSDLTVSILGIGGIGCNLALLATRLGIGKIHLIDYDIVEPSNLNRQSLFSKSDIGKTKSSCAKRALEQRDNISSKIYEYNYDIFEDWQRTISILNKSDIVLNGLDLPEIKRSILGILCYKMEKPMIYCGTDPHSGYSGMILVQTSNSEHPCYECLQAILTSVKQRQILKQYSVKNILEHDFVDWRKLESAKYQNLDSGATTIITAMSASTIAMNQLLHIIHEQPFSHRIIFDLYGDSIERYRLAKRGDCYVCGENHN